LPPIWVAIPKTFEDPQLPEAETPHRTEDQEQLDQREHVAAHKAA